MSSSDIYNYHTTKIYQIYLNSPDHVELRAIINKYEMLHPNTGKVENYNAFTSNVYQELINEGMTNVIWELIEPIYDNHEHYFITWLINHKQSDILKMVSEKCDLTKYTTNFSFINRAIVNNNLDILT